MGKWVDFKINITIEINRRLWHHQAEHGQSEQHAGSSGLPQEDAEGRKCTGDE